MKTQNTKKTLAILFALALVALVGIGYQVRLVSTHGVDAETEGTSMGGAGTMMSGGHMGGMAQMMRSHMGELSDEEFNDMHEDCMKSMQEDHDE